MKKNEKDTRMSSSGIRMLVILGLISICCLAMAPSVAANGTFIDNASVTASASTPYGTFNGTTYNETSFYGIAGLAGYDYTWTQHPVYSDRKPLYNLTVFGQVYPEPDGINPTGWKWNIVDTLDQNAYLYKKSLAGIVTNSGTYYLWYGNDTAARGCLNGRCDWLFPTVQNATYIVKLNVTVVP